MVMKRLTKPMGERTPMQRLTKNRMLGMRPAMGFIEPARDPLSPADPNALPEQQEHKAMSELLRGFKERAKAEAIRFAETTRTDYYFTVVFEHGDQANAFLAACGYPRADDMFVDGTQLAKALEIEIPKSPFKLRALKAPDRSLHSLVTMIPNHRPEMKRLAALPAKAKRGDRDG